jgi:O-methyltransferase
MNTTQGLRSQYPDLTDQECEIIRWIAGYTMTSIERQITLIRAVRYLATNNIAGCFVECGVWRGGSSMAMALTLLQEQNGDRDIYLFDTFEGMPPPQRDDRTPDGTPAQAYLDSDPARAGLVWAVAGIEHVRQNMASTGYPRERIHIVKGPVEETLPLRAPTAPIALLRLDTDWYESTRHELTHLYPLLRSGGILIIDDYGHWQGAKKAVDEYFAALASPPFLQRIDYTARLLVKP